MAPVRGDSRLFLIILDLLHAELSTSSLVELERKRLANAQKAMVRYATLLREHSVSHNLLHHQNEIISIAPLAFASWKKKNIE